MNTAEGILRGQLIGPLPEQQDYHRSEENHDWPDLDRAAKMTDDDWTSVVAVNLSGAFFTSQAVLPHMIERGSGRIINISSLIGEM